MESLIWVTWIDSRSPGICKKKCSFDSSCSREAYIEMMPLKISRKAGSFLLLLLLLSFVQFFNSFTIWKRFLQEKERPDLGPHYEAQDFPIFLAAPRGAEVHWARCKYERFVPVVHWSFFAPARLRSSQKAGWQEFSTTQQWRWLCHSVLFCGFRGFWVHLYAHTESEVFPGWMSLPQVGLLPTELTGGGFKEVMLE